MKSMKNSSTWRFFLLTFIFFMAAVTIITAIFAHRIYQNERSHLDKNLILLEQVYLPFFTPALRSGDFKSLEEQISGIVQSPYISRVELRTNDGQFLSAGSPADPSLEQVSNNIVYVDEKNAGNLGKLTLFVTEEQIKADVWSSVLLIFLLYQSLALAFSGIIALVFHFMTGRHLLAFSSFLESDDPRRSGTLFSLNWEKARNDELQMLEEHFNRMRSRIGQYVEEIQGLKDLMQYIISHDPNGILVLDNELRYIFVSEKYLYCSENS